MADCEFCYKPMLEGHDLSDYAHTVCIREHDRRVNANLCYVCGENSARLSGLMCKVCYNAPSCDYKGYPGPA